MSTTQLVIPAMRRGGAHEHHTASDPCYGEGEGRMSTTQLVIPVMGRGRGT